MAEHGESHFSRRNLFKKGVAGSVLVGATYIASRLRQKPQKSEVRIELTPPQPLVTPTEIPQTPEELLTIRLQEIVDAPIFSNPRTSLEMKFATAAQTVEEIDKGLWVIQDEHARVILRDKKWQLRQKGNPDETGLRKLPEKLERWAEGKAIHPETFAWCWEANDEINQTLDALRINGGHDLSKRLNTGGLAMLTTLETQGFINVGRARATEQMPEERRGELFDLCARLEPIMGLNLYAPNIAGSQETTPGAQNGGAVGGQFTARTASHLIDVFQSIGKKFNPFDIRSSLLGGSVLIASTEGMGSPGFVRGDKNREVSGLTNWFGNHPDAIENVLRVDQDYQRDIVKSNISRF